MFSVQNHHNPPKMDFMANVYVQMCIFCSVARTRHNIGLFVRVAEEVNDGGIG